ncbi:MAG: glycoside hydrolase [Gemmatimonadaceae bacterium]|nr:glycoside hydrolase [Chitinophagaceae bacterium]
MKIIITLCIGLASFFPSTAQKNKPLVIAYYAGRTSMIDSFEVEKLSHIIYSFCHLKGNRLEVDNDAAKRTIERMIKLKSRNPALKIMLSLGGWGGCERCSPVFSTDAGRQEFALSVKELNDQLKTDGIDLDWEYPAIEGFPGHAFMPADKQNFTDLVVRLRKELGSKHEISFAAGGFNKFIDSSIEWQKVMPLVDRVNLMSYDLINGGSTETGHHTALFSTPQQSESTDNGVKRLLAVGVAANKIVIGAAMYARVFAVADTTGKGLYQKAKFLRYVPYRTFENNIDKPDWEKIFDTMAMAMFAFNASEKQFATFDDELSVAAKTNYVVEKGLNGIMFWQLAEDRYRDGLLEIIFQSLQKPAIQTKAK